MLGVAARARRRRRRRGSRPCSSRAAGACRRTTCARPRCPTGATAIRDPQPGTAPGLICPVGATRSSTPCPGVPYEMQAIVTQAILPDLRRRAGETSVDPVAARCARGASPSPAWPSGSPTASTSSTAPATPTIAFLASGIEGLKVRITAKAPDEADGPPAARRRGGRAAGLLGPIVFGVDDETMESVVAAALARRGPDARRSPSRSPGADRQPPHRRRRRVRGVPRRRRVLRERGEVRPARRARGAGRVGARRPRRWPPAPGGCSTPTSASPSPASPDPAEQDGPTGRHGVRRPRHRRRRARGARAPPARRPPPDPRVRRHLRPRPAPTPPGGARRVIVAAEAERRRLAVTVAAAADAASREHVFEGVHAGGGRGARRGWPTVGRGASRVTCRSWCCTTTGRRSGRRRTTPLLYVREASGDLLMVAANGGADWNPHWYWNLVADPAVEVEIDGLRFDAVAHVLDADERRAVWPTATLAFPGLDEQRRRRRPTRSR